MKPQATFGTPSYVEVEVRRIDGDHVDVCAGGTMRSFAIGHLPARLTSLLVPGATLGIQVADAGTLAALGPMEGEAIADLRDPDPAVCPVALGIIRTHAADPRATLRDFVAASALLAGTNGSERSRVDGGLVSYSVVEGALTAGYEDEDAAFEAGAIIVRVEIPQTVANAGVGTPVLDVVDHPLLRDVGAVISTITTDVGTTRIGWRVSPIRVRDLPEIG